MSTQCCYVLLRLEYHGSLYGGWQRQGKQGEDLSLPLPSVQQVVEDAAARVLNTEFITCAQVAGRTDKGVHALDQRCALRVPMTIDIASFAEKMNQQLRDNLIAVCGADVRRNERFDAVRKCYKYVLQIPRSQDDKRPIKELRQYSRHEWRNLDLHRLRSAMQLMEGTHDFQHLSKQKQPKTNTIRTVYAAYVSVAATSDDLPSFLVASSPAWNLDQHEFWIINVEGSGFLWNQVRRMVSLALKIAQGEWPLESVREVIEGKRVGPGSAAARGLYLHRVWLAGEED